MCLVIIIILVILLMRIDAKPPSIEHFTANDPLNLLVQPTPCGGCPSRAELPPPQYDIDDKITMLAERRKLNKTAIEGYVSKTADFFKKNFDNELEAEDNRIWWSRGE